MLKKLFLCLGLLSVVTYAKAPDGLIKAIRSQDIDSVQNFLKTDPTSLGFGNSRGKMLPRHC